MNRMHICIVTTAHPIDDVRVYQKICCSLLEKGCIVTWVGPNWRQGDQGFLGDERITYKLVKHKPGKFGRISTGAKVSELASDTQGVDWYYAPDPDSARIVAKLARARGARSVFDIHENFHDAPIARWLGPFAWRWVRSIARKYISRLASKCDVVIAVNECILSVYASDHPHASIVRNCAPIWFAKNFGGRSDLSLPFRIMHGKAEPGRGTIQVLEALKLLRNESLALEVVMIDPPSSAEAGEEAAIACLLKSESKMIRRQKRVGMQEMPELLSTCAAGLISYQRDLGIDSLPNRLFEYMAAGVAVIAPSYSKEIAKIIEAEGCGVLLDFENPHSIAAAMRDLAKNPERCAAMGEAGRRAFLMRHNWQVEFDNMLSLLSS